MTININKNPEEQPENSENTSNKEAISKKGLVDSFIQGVGSFFEKKVTSNVDNSAASSLLDDIEKVNTVEDLKAIFDTYNKQNLGHDEKILIKNSIKTKTLSLMKEDFSDLKNLLDTKQYGDASNEIAVLEEKYSTAQNIIESGSEAIDLENIAKETDKHISNVASELYKNASDAFTSNEDQKARLLAESILKFNTTNDKLNEDTRRLLEQLNARSTKNITPPPSVTTPDENNIIPTKSNASGTKPIDQSNATKNNTKDIEDLIEDNLENELREEYKDFLENLESWEPGDHKKQEQSKNTSSKNNSTNNSKNSVNNKVQPEVITPEENNSKIDLTEAAGEILDADGNSTPKENVPQKDDTNNLNNEVQPEVSTPEENSDKIEATNETLNVDDTITPEENVPQKDDTTKSKVHGTAFGKVPFAIINDIKEEPQSITNNSTSKKVNTSSPTEETSKETVTEKEAPLTSNKLSLVLVSIEEKLKRIAGRLAQERLDREMKEMKGIKGIIKKWWTRNAAEGYLDRYTSLYLKRIKEEPQFRAELMGLQRDTVRPISVVPQGGIPAKGPEFDLKRTGAASKDDQFTYELDAIAARFGIAWNEESTGNTMAKEDLLTKNETLIKKKTAQYNELKETVTNLAKAFLEDKLNEEGFRKAFKTQILSKVEKNTTESVIAFMENRDHGGDIMKMGMLDKLNAMKVKIHADKLKGIDNTNFINSLKIDIALGRAEHVDARTEERHTSRADKIAKNIISGAQRFFKDIPFLGLGHATSPTALSVGVYGLANIASNYGISALTKLGWGGSILAFGLAPAIGPAVLPLAAGVITGSLMAGLRENKEVSRLKKQKESRDALSHKPTDDTIDPKAKKRFERQLEQKDTLYEKRDVQDLISTFDRLLQGSDSTALWKHYVHVRALRDVSEYGITPGGERLDLIRFSSEKVVEKERLDLLYRLSVTQKRFQKLPDFQNQFNNALSIESDRLVGEINKQDLNFRSLKRKAIAGAAFTGAWTGLVGSLAGGVLASGFGEINHYFRPGAYTYGKDGLVDWLQKNGWSSTKVSEHIHFTNGKLTPESLTYLTEQGFTLKEVPSFTDMGTPTNMSSIKAALASHGLDPSKFVVDSNGHVQQSTIEYLKDHGLSVSERTPELVDNLANAGTLESKNFSTLASIHFNQNISGKHILDELRFHWDGAPSVGSDGNVHFKINEMFNTNLQHSTLPTGVKFPTDMRDMQFGLQVNQGGQSYWQFFPADSSGRFSIPAEYFEGKDLGYVARGGDSLPGLKTSALAVGFKDHHGTYQVLASLRGDGNYTPSISEGAAGKSAQETINYTLKQLDPNKYIVPTQWFVTPPVPVTKMKHLEYGTTEEEEETSDANEKKEVPKPGIPPILPPVNSTNDDDEAELDKEKATDLPPAESPLEDSVQQSEQDFVKAVLASKKGVWNILLFKKAPAQFINSFKKDVLDKLIIFKQFKDITFEEENSTSTRKIPTESYEEIMKNLHTTLLERLKNTKIELNEAVARDIWKTTTKITEDTILAIAQESSDDFIQQDALLPALGVLESNTTLKSLSTIVNTPQPVVVLTETMYLTKRIIQGKEPTIPALLGLATPATKEQINTKIDSLLTDLHDIPASTMTQNTCKASLKALLDRCKIENNK